MHVLLPGEEGGLRTLRDSGLHTLSHGSPPQAARLRWERGLGRRLGQVPRWRRPAPGRGEHGAGAAVQRVESPLPAFCLFFVLFFPKKAHRCYRLCKE